MEDHGKMQVEFITQQPERILPFQIKGAEHLLQGDHVGLELRDDEAGTRDIRLGSAVHPLPSMHVIGRDPHGFAHDHRGYRPSGTLDEAQMWFENRAERGGFLDGLETIASLDAQIADPGNRTGTGLDREFPSANSGLAGAVDGAFGTITSCGPGSYPILACAAAVFRLFDHNLPCLRSLQGDRSDSCVPEKIRGTIPSLAAPPPPPSIAVLDPLCTRGPASSDSGLRVAYRNPQRRLQARS